MRKTGITKETVKRLVLDAGVVYRNWSNPNTRQVLGACRGGNQFVVNTDVRDMEFDGTASLVEGSRRIIKTHASLTVNLVEINKDLLKMAVVGSSYGTSIDATDEAGVAITGENYYKIKRVLTKTIEDFDYEDIAIVAEYSGTKAPVVCGLTKALANGNLDLKFTDADEGVLTIEFTGFADADNPEVEPWFILIPEKIPSA
jgi:hypothetical protein